jgi:hypothetical protein
MPLAIDRLAAKNPVISPLSATRAAAHRFRMIKTTGVVAQPMAG